MSLYYYYIIIFKYAQSYFLIHMEARDVPSKLFTRLFLGSTLCGIEIRGKDTPTTAVHTAQLIKHNANACTVPRKDCLVLSQEVLLCTNKMRKHQKCHQMLSKTHLYSCGVLLLLYDSRCYLYFAKIDKEMSGSCCFVFPFMGNQ